MKGQALLSSSLAAFLLILLAVGTANPTDQEELSSSEPWEVVFTVDGSWALAIQTYNGKLYVAERDLDHNASIYQSSDGLNFTKVFNTECDQVFVMGVNELNNTLYIGSLYRIGQGIGRLYYYDGVRFGRVPEGVWWNSSSIPAVPLSMHMYKNRFFVGGLSWSTVPESDNKMWVKFEDQNSSWHWTDMSETRLGEIIEAYSMEEYEGRLYVGTFEPARVVVYDDESNMWNVSLSGWVDGSAVGNSGVIELINYSGKLHGLTWKYGYHWQYDGFSWNGTNVSQYGGFGRAIEHNGVMYAGTTPMYGGIKPWTGSNFSRYNGLEWTDVAEIDTIHPQYFTKFQGYIYATAGNRVYRRNISPFPPIADPPGNVHARLEGPGFEDVNITWELSDQDSFVVSYSIYYSDTLRRNKQGYWFLDSVPSGTGYYVHANAGHGNPSNFFYYVQANGTNNSVKSREQAGKFTRPVAAGLELISIPLLQLDSSIPSVLETIRYDRVWTYDSSSLEIRWKSLTAEKKWSGLSSIDIRKGYWVNVTFPGQLTVAGRVPERVVIYLKEGWNLISFPSFDNYDASRVIMETGATRVEEYDAMNGIYHLREMERSSYLWAGKGYWIYLPVDFDWLVS